VKDVRVRAAWSLAAFAGVCAVADTVLTGLRTPLLSLDAWAEHGWPSVTLATLGSALMGALIVSRYPRHPVGWLLMVAGMSSLSISSEAYYLWAFDGDGHGPAVAGHVAGWVSSLLGAPLAMTAVILVLLIAPDGRLLSPRWRWVGRSALLGLALYTATVLSLSPTTFDLDEQDLGPGMSVLANIGVTMMIVSLVTATVGLGVRLHRAQGETRRQLLWIAASAVLLAGSFAWLLLIVGLNGGEQSGLAVFILFLGYLSVPVCTAVAVLRHRLFDIDVVVNRALVVFFAAAFAAGAYVLVVVALGAVVGGRTGFWPSLLVTAAVALAFQPLRRRVVGLADRLAFGASAEPYDALAEFSRRLGESPDPSDLLPAVAEAAAGAVGARGVAVDLTLPFGPALSATWPAPAAAGVGQRTEIAIVDDEEQLGTLTVEMPPGRGLRDRDAALLRDLADQSLVAFRNARLSAELAHRVDLLDLQAQALEESRRRLIDAADAERRRLEHAVRREVAPHLDALPSLLESLGSDDAPPVSADDVQRLRGQVEQALEALRDITRGVYPAQLQRAGLEPALRSLIARTPDARLLVDGDPLLPRNDSRVEAAAYFCVAEAVRALTGPVEVTLTRRPDEVVVVVEGTDGAELPVPHMRDRAEALDGTVTSRRTGGRIALEARLPVRDPAVVSA
jgi:signal transduction histidine kinase